MHSLIDIISQTLIKWSIWQIGRFHGGTNVRGGKSMGGGTNVRPLPCKIMGERLSGIRVRQLYHLTVGKTELCDSIE